MKKYLKMFLIFLVLFQLILVLASIGSYSDTGSISLLCISLSISLINIVVVIVLIFKKEKDLYKLVETDDYFRDLNFKLIDPLSAGVVTKTSKIGFNSIMIIIYELIDKDIIVRKYHNFYISNILSFLTLFGLEAILEIIFAFCGFAWYTIWAL